MSLTATLDGAQVVPHITTAGTGLAKVTVDDVSGLVHVQGTYGRLNGSATVAHLHGLAPAGSTAGPLISYTGFLDGAQASTGSAATGTYIVSMDRNTNLVTVQGDYANLQGNVQAAHLHGAAWFGQAAGLMFGLTHTGGTTGTLTASVTVADTQLDDILDGFSYLNLHTAAFGGGELRGQVIGDSLGTAYCQPALNSVGAQGSLLAAGSPRAMDNDVTLMASNLPPNAFGYIVASQSTGQTYPVSGSMGRICIAGPNIGHLGGTIQSSGPSGTMSAMIDLTLIPGNPPSAVAAGDM